MNANTVRLLDEFLTLVAQCRRALNHQSIQNATSASVITASIVWCLHVWNQL